MAGFEGIHWSDFQARFLLKEHSFSMHPMADTVPAVSRSIHYGLFLSFEGIRYFVAPAADGSLELRFLNLHKNLERFRRSIAFNLGTEQQGIVPSTSELETLLLTYFRTPEMRPFVINLAQTKRQGYLRPFTVDESQSIGVTFPDNPSIRIVTCSYDRYMGEPFSGVVVPHLVRAVAANGTGCLKLGVNYLLSVKAVDAAKRILPTASSALFLDDRLDLPLRDRAITEWDSSCCLIALADGTVVKIPESPLILPSVTIQGICAILRGQGITVDERHVTYGEFLDRAAAEEVVAICSIGTAGILNRAQQVVLVDAHNTPCGAVNTQPDHELYQALGQAKQTYWAIYRGEAAVPQELTLQSYQI